MGLAQIREAYIFRCYVSLRTMDMLDGVASDQLRTFIATVDEGSVPGRDRAVLEKRRLQFGVHLKRRWVRRFSKRCRAYIVANDCLYRKIQAITI
jgi:hypothetical protein